MTLESLLDYRVPVDKFTPLAEFDGSVIAERTAGEVSARCHDEQANFLAVNLVHEIVTGSKTVQEARDYYAKEFLDYRRKQPTPYMPGTRKRCASSRIRRWRVKMSTPPTPVWPDTWRVTVSP